MIERDRVCVHKRKISKLSVTFTFLFARNTSNVNTAMSTMYTHTYSNSCCCCLKTERSQIFSNSFILNLILRGRNVHSLSFLFFLSLSSSSCKLANDDTDLFDLVEMMDGLASSKTTLGFSLLPKKAAMIWHSKTGRGQMEKTMLII